jgi:hypothetical protein
MWFAPLIAVDKAMQLSFFTVTRDVTHRDLNETRRDALA